MQGPGVPHVASSSKFNQKRHQLPMTFHCVFRFLSSETKPKITRKSHWKLMSYWCLFSVFWIEFWRWGGYLACPHLICKYSTGPVSYLGFALLRLLSVTSCDFYTSPTAPPNSEKLKRHKVYYLYQNMICGSLAEKMWLSTIILPKVIS